MVTQPEYWSPTLAPGVGNSVESVPVPIGGGAAAAVAVVVVLVEGESHVPKEREDKFHCRAGWTVNIVCT